MSTNNYGQDSLDQQRELLQYKMHKHRRSHFLNPQRDSLNQQDLVYKNFYKQQLDDLVRQKNQQKRMEKERQAKQRSMYNQRLNQGIEAQRLKDLSYKNYYQMLLNNQNSHSKAYVSPFDQREKEKDKLIYAGVEVGQKRSQMWYQQEQRRNEEMKKNYRELLAEQINDKHHKSAFDKEVKVRQQELFTKATYTPQELARFERERKLLEMQKYKEDLDQSSPNMNSSKVSGSRLRSQTGPYIKNEFNLTNIQSRHDPLVNPVPYNIQNPYILKDMKRKQTYQPQIQASNYY